MDNLPDKDIDYIFREGSEKHDFPFKESAWDNMDALLDKEVKKRDNKKWIFLLLLFGAIAGIGLTGYWANTSKKAIPNTTKEYTPVITETESLDIAINESKISNEDTRTIDQTTNKKKAIPNLTNRIVDNENNTIQKKTLLTDENQINVKTNKYNPPFTDKASSTLTKIERSKHLNSAKTTDKWNPPTDENRRTDTAIDRVVFNINPISFSLLNTLKIDPTYDENNLKRLPKLDLAKTRNHKFKLGLVLGQEWSSVGMMNDSKKGYKLGLELAYQFGNRFQVSTGFIASKKKYETQGINYNARVERWVDEVTPQTVQGTCDIFEIPLDFVYYFKGYETSSFYINAGLNSYIMQKEWYDYEYESGTNMQGLPTFWTGKMKNNHFLSVSNFSIGYQKVLNDKMTIQLAPYIQIPLTGIGDGQVKLYTTGFQMKMLFGK